MTCDYANYGSEPFLDHKYMKVCMDHFREDDIEVLYKHNDERNQGCPHCRKTYKSKDVLDRHIMLSHGDVTPKRRMTTSLPPVSYKYHLCLKNSLQYA
ncbi:hypothetical protein LOD99_10160 [Oopsacas minuta]|uniref:C2H2-type domain-containing protein n=1 Tax=Oopsacas minuta TaxID=111878 RepID=A0AAV7KNU7_9METZ|nr:hypothetical protein LOD99_10160 [Oopsacas minuta]